ncbi:hypothetical protein BDV29DRAFT_179629 [Aspergillus leporis]|uniref:Uncharacterized protein n=1 Tax=Aspergillus leporis TaxID=41062 RepID=A0A5N5WRM3_9EURO|nr:hypothetical protein BDV29DRAFT_179629 [Aspergillus leporis]
MSSGVYEKCTQCYTALASGNRPSSVASKCSNCAAAVADSHRVDVCYNCGRCALSLYTVNSKGGKYCGACAEALSRSR